MTQNNLGVAYRQLPVGDRAANLQQAIACYEQALRVFTPEAAPFDYATTQNNLGNAYADLPVGDRAANLREGHRLLRAGPPRLHPRGRPLRLRHDPEQPGHCLRRVAGGGPGGQPAEAIACYEQALRVFTPEAAPFDYAMTQNNLGDAYRQLPVGDRAANLQQAIACFEQALRVRTPEAAPLDYAMTQNNLGVAYRRVAGGGPGGQPAAGHRLLRAGPPRLHPRGRP